MNIRELADRYELQQSDFWEMKRSGRSIWIVTHDACERIGHKEEVKILSPEWLAKGEGPTHRWALQLRGYKGETRPREDEMLWTTGEADDKNCKSGYPIAIAEKRAKDRLILKLINAYEDGIYSEVESDDFGRGQAQPNPADHVKIARELREKLQAAKDDIKALKGQVVKMRENEVESKHAAIVKYRSIVSVEDNEQRLGQLVGALEQLAGVDFTKILLSVSGELTQRKALALLLIAQVLNDQVLS